MLNHKPIIKCFIRRQESQIKYTSGENVKKCIMCYPLIRSYFSVFVGPRDSEVCSSLLVKYFCLSLFLVPLAHDKTLGPSSCIQYLGIVMDSVCSEFRLPMEKIIRIRFLLSVLLQSYKTTVKLLQSLLGLLVFASRVMPMGCIFLSLFSHGDCWCIFSGQMVC